MNDFLQDECFEDKIDLTPLIDVIFMLLLFFILATTFIKPVVELTLPSADSAAAPARKEKELTLAVDRQGQVRHEGEAVDMEGVDRLLRAAPEMPVSLHVDKEAPFEAFMAVLDRVKLQGRENLAIVALPDSRRAP